MTSPVVGLSSRIQMSRYSTRLVALLLVFVLSCVRHASGAVSIGTLRVGSQGTAGLSDIGIDSVKATTDRSNDRISAENIFPACSPTRLEPSPSVLANNPNPAMKRRLAPAPSTTSSPTVQPTAVPTALPSVAPSLLPTAVPTTSEPTITMRPSLAPSQAPSALPTIVPTTSAPTVSLSPLVPPTSTPTSVPTAAPFSAVGTTPATFTFDVTFSLHNLTSTTLDSHSQAALTSAVAATLSLDESAVTFVSAAVTATHRRRLAGGSVSTTKYTYELDAVVQVRATTASGQTVSDLYTSLSDTLSDAVSLGDFSATLAVQVAAEHATQLVWAELAGLTVEDYTELTATTFTFDVTFSLHNMSANSLDSHSQAALTSAVADTLSLADDAVVFVSYAVTATHRRRLASSGSGGGSTSAHKYELDAVLTVVATTTVGQAASDLYASLSTTLSDAVSHGDFSATLAVKVAAEHATQLVWAEIFSLTVGAYSEFEATTFTFDVTFSLHNATSSTLDSHSQAALTSALAETLGREGSAVTYQSVSVTATHRRRLASSGGGGSTSAHKYELDVVLRVKATTSAGETVAGLYSSLSSTLSDAVSHGDFSATLAVKVAAEHATQLVWVEVYSVSVGQYSVVVPVTFRFDVTLSLHNVTSSTLDSLAQEALAAAVAGTLSLDESAVTFKSATVTTTHRRRLAGGSSSSGSGTSTHTYDLDAVVQVRTATSAGATAAETHASLSSTLTSAVSSGAFTSTLKTKAAAKHADSLAHVDVPTATVGDYTVESDAQTNGGDSGHGLLISPDAIAGVTLVCAVAFVCFIACAYSYWGRSALKVVAGG